eukprot:Rhum_TRINITY_DN14340_c13_g1::Rhum_TRINITY_DN14340_c13_g1_i1::g.83624::m.83624
MQASLLAAFVAACLLLAPAADAQCSGEPAWQSSTGVQKHKIVSLDGTADYVGMSWPEALTKLHSRCPIAEGGGGFTITSARTLLMCAINVAAFNNKVRTLTESLTNVPTMTGFDYDEATKECHLYYTNFAVIAAKVTTIPELLQWRPYVRSDALASKTTCYSFSDDTPCPTRSDMHLMFCPATSSVVFNSREEVAPDGNAYCCFEPCSGGLETVTLPAWFTQGDSGLEAPRSAVHTPAPLATMSPNVPRACQCPPSSSLEAAGETGFYCARVSTSQCEDMLYFAGAANAQAQATLSCRDGWVECHEPASPATAPQTQPQNLGSMYDCVSYDAPASATATVLCIGAGVDGGHHCVVPDADLNCPKGTRERRAPKILSLAADKLSTHGVKSVADAVTSAVAAMVEVTGLSGDSFSVDSVCPTAACQGASGCPNTVDKRIRAGCYIPSLSSAKYFPMDVPVLIEIEINAARQSEGVRTQSYAVAIDASTINSHLFLPLAVTGSAKVHRAARETAPAVEASGGDVSASAAASSSATALLPVWAWPVLSVTFLLLLCGCVRLHAACRSRRARAESADGFSSGYGSGGGKSPSHGREELFPYHLTERLVTPRDDVCGGLYDEEEEGVTLENSSETASPPANPLHQGAFGAAAAASPSPSPRRPHNARPLLAVQSSNNGSKEVIFLSGSPVAAASKPHGAAAAARDNAGSPPSSAPRRGASTGCYTSPSAQVTAGPETPRTPYCPQSEVAAAAEAAAAAETEELVAAAAAGPVGLTKKALYANPQLWQAATVHIMPDTTEEELEQMQIAISSKRVAKWKDNEEAKPVTPVDRDPLIPLGQSNNVASGGEILDVSAVSFDHSAFPVVNEAEMSI